MLPKGQSSPCWLSFFIIVRSVMPCNVSEALFVCAILFITAVFLVLRCQVSYKSGKKKKKGFTLVKCTDFALGMGFLGGVDFGSAITEFFNPEETAFDFSLFFSISFSFFPRYKKNNAPWIGSTTMMKVIGRCDG